VVNDINFLTIPEVIEETGFETGVDMLKSLSVKTLSSNLKLKNLAVPRTKLQLLSSTDRKLLNLVNTKKRSSMLITDDRQLRTVAREKNIRCYSTPLFIAYLIKNKMIEARRGVSFMNKLKEIYIRPKDIDAVIKHMEKRR
jgi:hypothetical protein